jgi:Rhodopirellula transposase DDE domain
MGAGEVVVAGLAEKFAEFRPHVDERGWRLYLGSEARARAAAEGCSLAAAAAVVAVAAGASRATVMAGAGELAEGAEAMPGRSRRPGAGRPAAAAAQPGLREALLELAQAATRGDPVAEVTWCSASLRDLSRQLAGRGFRCGKDAVAGILRAEGYSLQAMAKVLEGSRHPDRDAQFRHVNARIAEFRAAGDPVISVDAKKKEPVGPFARPGRSWQPRGNPLKVRDHDFADRELGRIVPYGIYDIAANRGFVLAGRSHDTAAFAVAAIRRWWLDEGSLRYPGARRLLVACDAGGSNGYRCRLWKDQLAILAAGTGLEIEVCHFPPGTSKWNKIEHRMFCHITRTWRARPLMTREDAVAGIAATVTATGLKCTAVLDDGHYPDGVEVSDQRMRYLEDRVLDRGAFHGEWNYTVAPAPRPAPAPQAPAPAAAAGPDPALLDALAALAGIPCLPELRSQAALEWDAAREHRLTLARGGTRRRNGTAGGYHGNGYAKLSEEAILAAAACRIRLRMTWALLGHLLGVHPSAISVPGNAAIPILRKHGITPHPGSPRITTSAQLHDHAATTGITITLHPPEPARHPQTPQPATHDTPETAN